MDKLAAAEVSEVEKEVEAVTPETPKSWRYFAAVVFLFLCAFISAIDSSILATALPQISNELDGSSVLTFWSATAFILAKTVVQPVWGSLSETFGRKQTMLATIMVFLGGSVVSARSSSMTMLVGGRTVQGIGGGGLVTLVEVLITDLVPLAKRGGYLSILALVWAFGTVIGPLIGGACAGAGQWRWIFYLNIPISVICLGGIAQFLTLRSSRIPFLLKLKRMDWIGIFVFTGSTTSLLFGITVGGTVYEWPSFRTILPLCLGAIGLLAFVFIEARVALIPMIPLKVFLSRTAFSGYAGTFLHGMTTWNLTIYLVFWFQSVRSLAPLQASIDTLPVIISTCLSSAVAGIVISKSGRFKYIIIFGWLFTTIGTGLLCLYSPTTVISQRIGFQIVLGIGAGVLFPSLQLAVQAPQTERAVGMAVAVFTFVRSFGQTFGVAMGAVIFQNQFDLNIANQNGNLPPEYVISGSNATSFVANLPSVPDTARTILEYVYADSLRIMWYVMVPFAGIGFLLSFLASDLSLVRKHDVAQGFEEKIRESKEGSESVA